MTKPFKAIIVALMAVMLTSCAAIHDSIDRGREVNLSAVKLGMTKAETQTALHKKPDNVVAAKQYPEAHKLIEVLQYSQWTDGNSANAKAPVVPVIIQSYWLYFVNDKLDKWEIADLDRKPRI